MLQKWFSDENIDESDEDREGEDLLWHVDEDCYSKYNPFEEDRWLEKKDLGDEGSEYGTNS